MIYPPIENFKKTNELKTVLAIIGPKQPLAILNPLITHHHPTALEAQKKEAQIFEKGKDAADGYHFISVQSNKDSEEVEGFWLLRNFEDV